MAILNLKIAHGFASMAFTASQTSLIRTHRCFRLAPTLLLLNASPKNQFACLSPATQSVSNWARTKNCMSLAWRLIQLAAIFLPSAITLPMCLVGPLRRTWMRVFAWSIEQAGVVWIKLFQYLSHRGDVIGDELADMFVYLREFCPQHSFAETQEIFQRVYGIDIQTYFDQFEVKPFASGSVSQVYSARLGGKKVAVKIRHPKIGENIQSDITLVFAISRFLTFFSRLFEIPINEQSLKDMLHSQLDFRTQQHNLRKYNQIFKNPDVHFPVASPQTSEEVLIMSFIEGKPITYYQKNKNQMNKFIARVGANAFFQMLIQHNFVHADCHGGNIMVSIKDIQRSPVNYFRYFWRMLKNSLWNKSIKMMLESQILRKFCDEQNEEDLQLRKQMLEVGKEVKVTLIDVGMVIQLEPYKRNYFINFLSEVIQGNPKLCAHMIHHISKYSGRLLEEGQHPQYLNDLETMFTLIKKVELQKLQGLDVLKGMLGVIRKHRMKLDGEFATLLTNMLVLQGIAKSLDPDINILRCAVSYLPYK